VMDKSEIFIEELGPRTIQVESRVERFEFENEWATGSVTAAVEAQAKREKGGNTGYEQEKEHHHGKYGRNSGDKEEESGIRERLTERHTGVLQRSFTFPSAVDISILKARLRYGLLVIRVPKANSVERGSKRINIED